MDMTIEQVNNLIFKYNKVALVTENGITISEIEYGESFIEDNDIYLIVNDCCECAVKINYNAIKRVRQWHTDKLIELTI